MKNTPKSLIILITLLLVLVGFLMFRIYKLEHQIKGHHPSHQHEAHDHDDDDEEEEDEFPLGEKMSKFFYFKNKMGRAIQHNNPELAEFYLEEIEEVAEYIIESDVHHEGVYISSLMQDKLIPALENLETQLEKGDNAQQRDAFENLVSSCNSCHKLAEHPFINVTVPQEDIDGQNFEVRE